MWDYIGQDLGKQNVDISDVVPHTLWHICASRLRHRTRRWTISTSGLATQIYRSPTSDTSTKRC